MRTKSILLVLIVSCLLFGGCKQIMFLAVVKKDINKQVKVYEHQETSKKIVYLPTAHLGKEAYFSSIKLLVDSLRLQNYTVLYEGVLTENTSDTIYRKFRKIAGFHLSGGYNNSENKSLPGRYQKKKYVNQTLDNTGIVFEKDINADFKLTDLIEEYERRHKEVALDAYDFNTPLNAKYKSKSTKEYNYYLLFNVIRDDQLFEVLQKYKDQNIVLLYGAGHKFMIDARLQETGFKMVQGKLF